MPLLLPQVGNPVLWAGTFTILPLQSGPSTLAPPFFCQSEEVRLVSPTPPERRCWAQLLLNRTLRPPSSFLFLGRLIVLLRLACQPLGHGPDLCAQRGCVPFSRLFLVAPLWVRPSLCPSQASTALCDRPDKCVPPRCASANKTSMSFPAVYSSHSMVNESFRSALREHPWFTDHASMRQADAFLS